MIKYLKSLDLSVDDIHNMIEMNKDILNENLENAKKNIETLKFLKCKKEHIKNILISNPYYLSIPNENILEIVCYLQKLGMTTLYILFDSNPYILNKNGYDIKQFVKTMLNNGYSLVDILEMVNKNPYIFDDILV